MVSAPGPLEALVGRLNALQARALIGEHAIGGAMAFIYAVAIALRTWRGTDREHIDRLIRTGRRPLDVDRLHSILARYGLGEKWRRFKEMYDVDLG